MRKLRFLTNPADAIRVRDNDFAILQQQNEITIKALSHQSDFEENFSNGTQYDYIHSRNIALTPIIFEEIAEQEFQVEFRDAYLLINSEVCLLKTNENTINLFSLNTIVGNETTFYAIASDTYTESTPRPTLLGATFQRVQEKNCTLEFASTQAKGKRCLAITARVNSNNQIEFFYRTAFSVPDITIIDDLQGTGTRLQVQKTKNICKIKLQISANNFTAIPITSTPFVIDNITEEIYRPKNDLQRIVSFYDVAGGNPPTDILLKILPNGNITLTKLYGADFTANSQAIGLYLETEYIAKIL